MVSQGLLGWWMVQSGLKSESASDDTPRVSQYRLASHLGLALLLYSSMLYTALGILAPPKTTPPAHAVRRLRHVAHAATGFIFLTALSGELPLTCHGECPSHSTRPLTVYAPVSCGGGCGHVQVHLWRVSMLGLFTTPSPRWRDSGSQRSGCNCHQNIKTSLKTQALFSWTTEPWYTHMPTHTHYPTLSCVLCDYSESGAVCVCAGVTTVSLVLCVCRHDYSESGAVCVCRHDYSESGAVCMCVQV